MASSDWTFLTGGLSVGTVERGVTTAITPPNGGGSFIYGFNSLDTSEGVVGLFANQVDFAPMAKGGSVRGAIQRGPSGGKINFAPFFFVGFQGTAVTDKGYLFGLADGDPSHIILRKGSPSGGLADVAPDPPTNDTLLRSTKTVDPGEWVHIRIDMIVNDNGDVILQCFESDLTADPVSSPSWSPIDGMEEFIDDTLQVQTGSAPFTSGRGGLGFYTKDVTRRGYFDHIEVIRQL